MGEVAQVFVFMLHMCFFICVVYLSMCLLYVCGYKHVSCTQKWNV